ncbi:MAG: glycogen/starch/alpha-glucan phosphorylase [Vicinamibacteria bacterium]
MTTRSPGVEGLEDGLRRHLRLSLGIAEGRETSASLATAAALAVRDRLMEALLATERREDASDAKRVYYLSMEFLVGRSLECNLQSLGLLEAARAAVAPFGRHLADLCDAEADAALGNGGLGRLAACFLDSMATLGIPGHGYGINYEFGLFRQEIDGGWQRERPDQWRAFGSPWLVEQPDQAVVVPCYGHVEHGVDAAGGYNPLWMGWRTIVGVPSLFPVVGHGGRTVNVLRLFTARASEEFDIEIFNEGDYIRAVEEKVSSETVSKVLYPSDAAAAGRELRLLQEYFLVACAMKDAVRRFLARHSDLADLPRHVAVQLNDTHPALAVVELMRILVDEHAMGWEPAWEVTEAVFAYTNHTLMPEALEKWPVPLFERVLPRHLQLLYEINRRFLDTVAARWPGERGRESAMSLIEEREPKHVRMAHLAIVGSHSVNGVAALHSELVKTRLVPDFHQLWPAKFNNKTNGVTPRRWLLTANPGLSGLITEALGDGWVTDLERLRDLEPLAEDAAFRGRFAAVKTANKERLAGVLRQAARVAADPASLFDVQVKRIHEYKRQLLNVLQVALEYLQLVEDGLAPPVARTCIFAGKAAPGYWAAKQVIQLVASIASVVNGDPRTRGLLRIAYVPDYRVSLAEVIVPAGDLSEQISTAGTEASGTSNMKFALNGALTLGTLDGANIEIRDAVGDDNIFIFGLTADEAHRRLADPDYRPRHDYEADASARRVVDAIAGGRFSPDAAERFAWLRGRVAAERDPYLHLADRASYASARERAARRYAQPDAWYRAAILNVARVGRFSSDRTVAEYARDIWGVRAL